jgi:hypothetical protein
MSDLSFAEIDGQHVELLPARTVLSLFARGGGCVVETGDSQSGTGAGLLSQADVGVLLGNVLSGSNQGDSGTSASGNAAC